MYDLVLSNGLIVLPEAGVVPGHLAVHRGKVASITAAEAAPPDASREIDTGGAYVLPGLVDTHFHLGYWNPFEEEVLTESWGAALGGVTSMCVMLKMKNVPAEHRSHSFLDVHDYLQDVVRRASVVDVVIRPYPNTPEQIEEIPKYVEEMGTGSFKFATHFHPEGEEARLSGVWRLRDGELLRAFELIRDAGAVAVVHAENQEIIDAHTDRLRAAGRNDLPAWTESRPDVSEAEAISHVAFLAHAVGVPVYFAHVSSAAGLAVVRDCRERGWQVFAETCPHYLCFTAESDLGPLGKQKPPLRDEPSREALWEGLANGTVDCIGSDHMPLAREDSLAGDIWDCYWGFPVVETLLPVMMTFGVLPGRITIQRLAQVCSLNAARLFGLYPRKGTLQVGSDADLVVVDPNREAVVDGSTFPSYSDFSLWDRQSLRGWPRLTLRRGEVVMQDGVITASGGGTCLRREIAHNA